MSPREHGDWRNTRKLTRKTVTITVVVQVNAAGEQHVDVEFHSVIALRLGAVISTNF